MICSSGLRSTFLDWAPSAPRLEARAYPALASWVGRYANRGRSDRLHWVRRTIRKMRRSQVCHSSSFSIILFQQFSYLWPCFFDTGGVPSLGGNCRSSFVGLCHESYSDSQDLLVSNWLGMVPGRTSREATFLGWVRRSHGSSPDHDEWWFEEILGGST